MELISREQVIATIDSFNVFESRSDQIKLELMIGELPIAGVGTNLASLGTDCISRQSAINAIDECYCGGEDSCGEPWIYKENAVEAIQMIEPILPAEPKRGKWIKTARWGRVYYCDQCRNYLDFDGVNAGRGSTNYCPNCGADMRGEQDG